MSEEQSMTYVVQGREVDRDDIEQEAAIFEWQTGKRANRALIARNLANDEPASTFAGDPSAIASPLPVGMAIPDPKVINQLVEWSLAQSVKIREAILEFLEEPGDDSLNSTLALLIDEGIIAAITPEKPVKKAGFIDALMRLLQTDHRDYSSTELYDWARTVHLAKRPEATVRQAMRRLIEQGKVVKTSQQTYRYVGGVIWTSTQTIM
jgi:hypothetical protein